MKFFEDKHHKQMLKDVKSRVGVLFNDPSISKNRMNLVHFKREQGLDTLRQIDKKNLKLFVRLSQVQPSVPVVVKRSLVEATELEPILDYMETVGLNSSQ